MLTLRVKGCKFLSMLDLCSALKTIEHWGFFSLPHPLWQGLSVYNGHLRRHVTITPIAEHLAVELQLPVFTSKVCRGWDLNSQPSACGPKALTHCATVVVYIYKLIDESNDHWSEKRYFCVIVLTGSCVHTILCSNNEIVKCIVWHTIVYIARWFSSSWNI